jgi:Transposase and inactivated derivatives
VRRVFAEETTAIVADKFHVLKSVNTIIDLCRIAVEKSNNERLQIKRLLLMKTETLQRIKRGKQTGKNGRKWQKRIERFERHLRTHPEIRLLWDLKNKFHGFYRCASPASAQRSFDAILAFLARHEADHPEFRDLQKTLRNWEREILNYFIHRTTNAYIEGLNNRIETFKRKKWGFRNLQNFLKALCYMMFPISATFTDVLLTH